MARTIATSLLTLLVGILLGAIIVHQHHKKLWRQQMELKKSAFFEMQRSNSSKPDRLPPVLIEKIEQSLQSSESEIATQIESLPFYQQLTLQERSKFMERIHRFREKQIELTKEKMNELGLDLNESKKNDFQKSFFEKRKANRKSLQSKSKEWMHNLEKQSDEELRTEFAK